METENEPTYAVNRDQSSIYRTIEFGKSWLVENTFEPVFILKDIDIQNTKNIQ